MKKFIVLCAFFTVIAVVYSVDPAEPIPILRSDSTLSEDGSYSFVYESGDGSVREEVGTVVNPGSENPTITISGRYKYIDADGQEISVEYTADENGFVPVGNNIPQQISDSAANARNHPQDDQPPSKAQPFKG